MLGLVLDPRSPPSACPRRGTASPVARHTLDWGQGAPVHLCPRRGAGAHTGSGAPLPAPDPVGAPLFHSSAHRARDGRRTVRRRPDQQQVIPGRARPSFARGASRPLPRLSSVPRVSLPSPSSPQSSAGRHRAARSCPLCRPARWMVGWQSGRNALVMRDPLDASRVLRIQARPLCFISVDLRVEAAGCACGLPTDLRIDV